MSHSTLREIGRLLIAALLAIACSPVVIEAQCAMCRRALQSPEGQQIAAAFRSGILFLLAAPFVVFGAVAMLAVRRQRRRSVDQRDGGAAITPTPCS